MSVRVILRHEKLYRELLESKCFSIQIVFSHSLQNNSLEVTLKLKNTLLLIVSRTLEASDFEARKIVSRTFEIKKIFFYAVKIKIFFFEINVTIPMVWEFHGFTLVTQRM